MTQFDPRPSNEPQIRTYTMPQPRTMSCEKNTRKIEFFFCIQREREKETFHCLVIILLVFAYVFFVQTFHEVCAIFCTSIESSLEIYSCKFLLRGRHVSGYKQITVFGLD